jgi:hypothetical protein
VAVRLKSRIPIRIELEDGQVLQFSAKRIAKFKEGSDLKARYRAAKNAKEGEGDQLFHDLFVDAFRRYLRIDEPIIVERDDGTEIAISDTGELVEELGGRQDILARIFWVIMGQIELNAAQKKVSSSPTDSTPSFPEPSPEAPGPKQGTTATSAEPSSSVDSGGASSPAEAQSGPTSTDQATQTPGGPSSSSTSVPFVF